jgi:hypothetical protein
MTLALRFRAFAIDRAMLVLPTPGGPWKQRILPPIDFFKMPTAMNSCKQLSCCHIQRESIRDLQHIKGEWKKRQ